MPSKKLRISMLLIAGALAASLLLAIAVTLAASPSAISPANARVQAVERLVIRYSAAGFELVSRTPLMKVLPPSVALPAEKGAVSGSWFEVQGDGGDVVYRRRFDSPRIIYTEVPTADNPGVLKRDEAIRDENVFSVLVPAGKDAKSLVFYDSSLDTRKRSEAANEAGRIGLR